MEKKIQLKKVDEYIIYNNELGTGMFGAVYEAINTNT